MWAVSDIGQLLFSLFKSTIDLRVRTCGKEQDLATVELLWLPSIMLFSLYFLFTKVLILSSRN
jgi:hypothetical protein